MESRAIKVDIIIRREPLSCLSCRQSVSVCFVSSRSSRQRCMSSWSRKWRVSDPEDMTEVTVCRQLKAGWRQNEFQSKREVRSKEWGVQSQELSPLGHQNTRQLSVYTLIILGSFTGSLIHIFSPNPSVQTVQFLCYFSTHRLSGERNSDSAPGTTEATKRLFFVLMFVFLNVFFNPLTV